MKVHYRQWQRSIGSHVPMPDSVVNLHDHTLAHSAGARVLARSSVPVDSRPESAVFLSKVLSRKKEPNQHLMRLQKVCPIPLAARTRLFLRRVVDILSLALLWPLYWLHLQPPAQKQELCARQCNVFSSHAPHRTAFLPSLLHSFAQCAACSGACRPLE